MAEQAQAADDLRKTQESLKTQVRALEESLKAPAKTGFLQAEMREMLQNLVLQNKRLSEKLDYLINLLVEAASAEESEVYDKTLAALAQAQVEALDQMAALKQCVDEAGKAEARADQADAQRVQALEEEVRRASALTEEKFKQLSDAVSKLSVSKQLEVLASDLALLRSQLSSFERAVPAAFEDSLNSLKASVANVQAELGALSSVVKEVRGEEKQLLELEEGLKKLEAELAAKTVRAYAGGLSDEDRQKLEELTAKMIAVPSEVARLEQALQAVTGGEAQQFSAVTRRLEQVEAELKKIEEVQTAADFQKAVAQQLAEFRAKLDGLAYALERVEKTFEKPADPVEAFIAKLPAGKPVALAEAAAALNMPEQDAFYKLVFLEKAKPGFLKLHNTGFFSKASRKKPFITRI